MTKPTCADCDYAATEQLEEWWDTWSCAHKREVIRCKLSGQPNYGHRFSANQVQPEACGWARVLIKQARDA